MSDQPKPTATSISQRISRSGEVEGGGLADSVVEVQPVGAEGGKIVWKWSAWDHLVQGFDPEKPNHGKPASRPERIDLNHVTRPKTADWTHVTNLD